MTTTSSPKVWWKARARRSAAALEAEYGLEGWIGEVSVNAPLGPERAVDLVGGDHDEAPHLLPVAGLEQHLGAEDVGANEELGPEDGSVHVALGGEVKHRLDPMLGQQVLDQLAIPDVAPDEEVPTRRPRAPGGSRGSRRR